MDTRKKPKPEDENSAFGEFLRRQAQGRITPAMRRALTPPPRPAPPEPRGILAKQPVIVVSPCALSEHSQAEARENMRALGIMSDGEADMLTRVWHGQ